MWIEHPKDKAIINISQYSDIRTCPKNPTHIDFYINPQAEGERGNPDYTIVFDSEQERDLWFDSLIDLVE